jgi:lysophospholipase L1-like esterase
MRFLKLLLLFLLFPILSIAQTTANTNCTTLGTIWSPAANKCITSMQSLGYTPLNPYNNLSDVNNRNTALSNLFLYAYNCSTPNTVWSPANKACITVNNDDTILDNLSSGIFPLASGANTLINSAIDQDKTTAGAVTVTHKGLVVDAEGTTSGAQEVQFLTGTGSGAPTMFMQTVNGIDMGAGSDGFNFHSMGLGGSRFANFGGSGYVSFDNATTDSSVPVQINTNTGICNWMGNTSTYNCGFEVNAGSLFTNSVLIDSTLGVNSDITASGNITTLTKFTGPEYCIGINCITAWLTNSITTSVPTLSTANLYAHYLMRPGSNPQRLYNAAYTGPRTNLAASSDDFTGWTAISGGVGGANQVTFSAIANSSIEASDALQGTAQSMAAGSYTITADAMLAAGSGTFRLCLYDNTIHSSPDFTLSNSWQTYSWTYTAATTSVGLSACLENGTAATAQTVLIRNLRLNAGTADLGIEPMPIWDGWLGKYSGVETTFDPAYSSTGLNYGSGNNYMATVRIPSDTTFTANTFYALFKISGTPITTNMATILGRYTASFFCVMCGSYPFPVTTAFSAPNIYINDGSYHIVTYVNSGSLGTIDWYMDGIQMGHLASGGGGILLSSFGYLNGFLIGNAALVSGFPGEIDDVLIYNAAHTPAQVAQNTAAMWSEISSRAIPNIQPPAIDKFLVLDGDSVTEQANAGGISYNLKYPMVAAKYFTPQLMNRSFGVSGNTCAQRTTARPNGVDTFLPGGGYLPDATQRALFLYCGTNDIGLAAGNISAQTVYNRIAAYVTAAKAAGWGKIGIATLLPFNEGAQSGGGCSVNNPVRDAVNTLLRVDRAGADILVDWAADPNIGADSACQTGAGTYTADGTHPNAAGSAIMAQYAEAGFASLFGMSVTLPAPTFSPISPYNGAATSVAISDSQSAATILYCQDTDNTCTPSTAYTSAISVSATGYIRAQATMSGWTSSSVASWAGTIE